MQRIATLRAWSDADGKRIVDGWRRNGESRAAIARRYGIPVHRLYYRITTAGARSPVNTLMLTIATLQPPDSGTIQLGDINVLTPAQCAKPLERDFKGVRVAWWTVLGGIPFEPEVRRVGDATRPVFESLGCVVEDDDLISRAWMMHF